MFRSAAIAAAATLALGAYNPAQATATANIQTAWAVYLEGLNDAAGVFTAGIPGISVTTTGDAHDGGGWWGNYLSLNQSVDNGAQSFDIAASGSLVIANSDPGNIGKTIYVREDTSGAWMSFMLGIDFPGLESASATASVTSPHIESTVQCSTGGGPGMCENTPTSSFLSDFSEETYGLPILSVGQVSVMDYVSFIHADLLGDPPASVPEPAFPWGFPLLLGAVALPYVRFGRGLG